MSSRYSFEADERSGSQDSSSLIQVMPLNSQANIVHVLLFLQFWMDYLPQEFPSLIENKRSTRIPTKGKGIISCEHVTEVKQSQMDQLCIRAKECNYYS